MATNNNMARLEILIEKGYSRDGILQAATGLQLNNARGLGRRSLSIGAAVEIVVKTAETMESGVWS